MKSCLTLTIIACSTVLFAACGNDDDVVTCDLAAPECPADHVCLARGADDPACEPACDPADPDACLEDGVCDRLQTGLAACFGPVWLTGQVFDLLDGRDIEGALVLAVGATGEAVTDVAVTDGAGEYVLRVPTVRDAHGTPVEGTFTLRAAADGYQPYPHGIRPAIPVDATTATLQDDGSWVQSNQTTSVGMIRLPEDQQGLGSISGTVLTDLPGGTLVVAECSAAPCPLAFADLSGNYLIYNVPDGSYAMKGYKAGYQFETRAVDVTDSADIADVDLATAPGPTTTLSGSIQIVNPEQGNATSVVLIPESVFQQISDTSLRGEVPPGLRAPDAGIAPDITGAFQIDGIPDGDYVVLAAFENDGLIRDPDPGISGTQIVHITIPDGVSGNTVTLGDSFKITGALTIYGPGAEGPEEVDPASLRFSWMDDSSEDQYILTVYDALGNLVWEDTSIPGYSGDDPDIAYAGPALQPGMYYQWRAVSLKDAAPKSTTEDLLGVFYVQAAQTE